MANTEHMGWPLPDTADDIDEEFFKLRDLTLPSIDAAVHALVVAVAAKAAADHPHQIGDITGLVQALAGKMAADATFSLADLSDVAGADDAPSGYVVVKDGVGFRVMSLAAAVGDGFEMSLVHGLNKALGDLADAIATKVGKNLSSGISDVVTARSNLKIWSGTQAQYDALDPKDAQTIYLTT